MSQLPIKLVELSGNIKEFHQYVNTITGALDSYGKQYPELILNLFDAYKKVKDHQFATYIMVTRFGYIAAPDTYQPRTLMNGVENLYKMQVQAGTWQPAMPKQQVSDIAALAARIEVHNNAQVVVERVEVKWIEVRRMRGRLWYPRKVKPRQRSMKEENITGARIMVFGPCISQRIVKD
jgi:hypothetical protein